MKKNKGQGKVLLAKCAVWGVIVVAFAGYAIATTAIAAQKSGDIQNAVNSSTRGIYLKDGTFSGSAQGYGGVTDVTVTVTNGYITNVTVDNTYDDAPYIENVEAQLIPDLIANQTTTIDVVTNASYSSNGVRFAVRNALRSAGAMPDSEQEAIAALKTSGATETDTLSIGYFLNQQQKDKMSKNTSGFAGGR